MSSTESRPSGYDRAVGAVADLEHPLYDDEHRRDVWNEASAVGFQVLSWALFVGCTAAVWLGGRASFPYALVAMTVLGAATVLVMAHAQRRGVDPWSVPGTGRARCALAAVVGLLLVAGMIRQADLTPGVAEVTGSIAGGIAGAGGATLLVVLAMRVARRRAPRGED